MVIENAVLFYVDGKQLFAQILDHTVSGALSFFCGDRVSYQDIVVFQDPITSIDYLDGNDRKKQTQLLEGVNCLVNQAIYDELGRGAVQTKTAQYDNTLFGMSPIIIQPQEAVSPMMGAIPIPVSCLKTPPYRGLWKGVNQGQILRSLIQTILL